MSDALRGLPNLDDENLLVGFDTADDGAVYRVADGLAIITTADFITPPVDDPYWFGQIAAANALSDIYAMGGRPITALNLVMFPKALDMGILREMLRGGADKVRESGAVIAGGHTVADREPKYGLSVNGVVSPDGILSNAGARVGDSLILTKPVGSGVIFNAVRDGKLAYDDIVGEVLPEVARLNRVALELALAAGDVHAATDITGFGLAGHLLEMARGSECTIALDYDAIPTYGPALAMVEAGVTTGSNIGNRRLSEGSLTIERDLTRAQEELLFDPQTSGGLVLSIPETLSLPLLGALRNAGLPAAVIGSVVAGNGELVVA